jgi:hypothetical protein
MAAGSAASAASAAASSSPVARRTTSCAAAVARALSPCAPGASHVPTGSNTHPPYPVAPSLTDCCGRVSSTRRSRVCQFVCLDCKCAEPLHARLCIRAHVCITSTYVSVCMRQHACASKQASGGGVCTCTQEEKLFAPLACQCKRACMGSWLGVPRPGRAPPAPRACLRHPAAPDPRPLQRGPRQPRHEGGGLDGRTEPRQSIASRASTRTSP